MFKNYTSRIQLLLNISLNYSHLLTNKPNLMNFNQIQVNLFQICCKKSNWRKIKYNNWFRNKNNCRKILL